MDPFPAVSSGGRPSTGPQPNGRIRGLTAMFRSMNSSPLPPLLARLLDAGIDYAGLFPPAGLSLEEAVENFAGYRAGPDRRALGRLIVPATRLADFIGLVDRTNRDVAGWRLSATLGAGGAGESGLVAEANRRLAGRGAAVDAVEAKVLDRSAVAALARSTEPAVAWYGEVALDTEFEAVLDAIVEHRGFAKIRMGGVTADLFPDPNLVVRFLQAVASRSLPFKATAGLHHPLRGPYPLTYLPASPTAIMYGYLNVMVATMLARQGAEADEIRAALIESDVRHLGLQGGGLQWRHHRFPGPESCRMSFHGFGSCSFREPIDELRTVLAS